MNNLSMKKDYDPNIHISDKSISNDNTSKINDTALKMNYSDHKKVILLNESAHKSNDKLEQEIKNKSEKLNYSYNNQEQIKQKDILPINMFSCEMCNFKTDDLKRHGNLFQLMTKIQKKMSVINHLYVKSVITKLSAKLVLKPT